MLSLTKVWYQMQGGSWLVHRPRPGLGSAVETRPQPCARVRKWQRPLSWQYRLWSFRFGGTKLGRFLPKSEQILRKFGYFWNGVMPTKQKFGPCGRNIFFSLYHLGIWQMIYRFWNKTTYTNQWIFLFIRQNSKLVISFEIER